MLNQIVLVGRLSKDIEVKKNKNGKEIGKITLEIQRSFKNANGIYETDLIDIILNDSIAKSTAEYCHKGDVVGIKGRVQTNASSKKLDLIAEKVTFLSKAKVEEDLNKGIDKGIGI